MESASNYPKSPVRPPAWRVVVVAGVLLSLGVFLLYDVWKLGRPIALPNAEHEKLECASYTPSHDGHVLSLAEQPKLIAADLKLLAERFRCVRTYSVSEGLDTVPRVARELGLKVMLGFWISSNAESNNAEITRGIALANAYPDVVTSIIVGNEVLLRRELTAPQLRALLERVRAETQIPVTYADVWEFWLRNAELANVANFVTIHILPYWEDNPIDIDRALDHVQSIHGKVQEAFPNKQVFIGETGWPSAGRPRLNAVPSLLNEARFIREFVAYAERERIPYNIIEAFDQPWKRIQEGTVGGYWGLYSATRDTKFSFTGPIVVNPAWRSAIVGAAIGAILFGFAGWLLRPRLSVHGLALLAIAGHVAGSMAFKQWTYQFTANRTALEWTANVAWVVFGWALYLAIVFGMARWIDGATLQRPAGIASIANELGHSARRLTVGCERLLGVLRIAVLFGLAYVCLSLAYDGRGRDFPLASITLPILALALLELCAPPPTRRAADTEELLLVGIAGLTTFVIVWNETWMNTRAMLWCGLCWLLVATIGVSRWRGRRTLNPHQSAEQQTDTAQLERI